jgi:hypothetical protein
MANADSVSNLYFDSFGNARLATVTATALNTAGNAAIAIPILSGGLTAGLGTANSGGIIIRRITVMNPSGTVALGNVSITTSNDGNISNAVVANVVLASVSGTVKFQDLAIVGGNVAVSGFTTQALYVNVNTASGNANTVDIRVYGDVISF